ncbi:hypothetical protein LLB_2127 [Legionella longbeachae D-4968]|nr:hypothetical protein LLB_2127 [Legionella longbeachae D-4968]
MNLGIRNQRGEVFLTSRIQVDLIHIKKIVRGRYSLSHPGQPCP